MNAAIAALLGQITWERACVLKIIKKETVDINIYRREDQHMGIVMASFPRVK